MDTILFLFRELTGPDSGRGALKVLPEEDGSGGKTHLRRRRDV